MAGPRPKSKNLIKKNSKTRNLKPKTTSLAMQQLGVHHLYFLYTPTELKSSNDKILLPLLVEVL